MPSREDAFRLRAFNFACDIVRLFQRLERRLPGTIARAREVSYWLRLITATELVRPDEVAGALEEANQFAAMLTASVARLKIPHK